MDTEKNPKLGELRRKAMSLPLLPGVYIMKDAQSKSSTSAKPRH